MGVHPGVPQPGVLQPGGAPTRGSLVPFHTPTNHFIIIYIPRLYLFCFCWKLLLQLYINAFVIDKKKKKKKISEN